MRTRRRILILLACGGLLGILFGALHRDNEPQYEGYTLSHWLPLLIEVREDSEDYPTATQAKAEQAIKYFGTNASPFLADWLRHETPMWRAKVPASISVHLPKFIRIDKAEVRAVGSLQALKILGPTASGLVPELSKLMNDPEAWETADRATAALAYMGTNALSPLLATLVKPSPLCRSHIADAVGELLRRNPNATSAVPVLVNCLSDQDRVVKYAAAEALGNPKLPTALVIPALTSALQSSDSALRWNAAYALGKCQTSAVAAVPTLMRALDDSNSDVRFIAAEALRKIAPEILTNAPAQ